jgi:hypothetical protein
VLPPSVCAPNQLHAFDWPDASVHADESGEPRPLLLPLRTRSLMVVDAAAGGTVLIHGLALQRTPPMLYPHAWLLTQLKCFVHWKMHDHPPLSGGRLDSADVLAWLDTQCVLLLVSCAQVGQPIDCLAVCC